MPVPSKQGVHFPSLRRQRAFENNLENSGEAFPRHHPELFHLRRIHDRLNNRQQNFGDQFDRNILADHSGPLPFNEKVSEVTLNQRSPAALDHFEYLRRFLTHVAHERRLDLVQFALGPSE